MISESVLQLLKVKLKGNSTKSNLGFHLYNKNNIMETIFFTRPSDIETSLGTPGIFTFGRVLIDTILSLLDWA